MVKNVNHQQHYKMARNRSVTCRFGHNIRLKLGEYSIELYKASIIFGCFSYIQEMIIHL